MKFNNKKIHKKVTLIAPISMIWWKWTTHEGLKTFLGADNLIDLRPGGPFEIYFLMDAPEGSRGGEGNKILSFLPEQMLSFSWNAPPTIPEIRNQDHRTWVIIHLKATDKEHTEVTLDHLGWLDGEKWDETYTYFDQAWDMVLNSLADSCIDYGRVS